PLKFLCVFFAVVTVMVRDIEMPFVQILRFYISCLFPVSGNSGVQGDPVHPRCDFGIPPECMEGLPKLEYDLLEKVVAYPAVMLVHDAYFVDQSLVRID